MTERNRENAREAMMRSLRGGAPSLESEVDVVLKRQIRSGWIAAVVQLTLSALLMIILDRLLSKLGSGPKVDVIREMRQALPLDIAILAAGAVATYHESRIGASILVAHFVFGLVGTLLLYQQLQHFNGMGAQVIFGYFYIRACIATFKLGRKKS